YCNNREWLIRLGVWVNCEGTRRPSSSFILATLTALEPQLTRLMPLMVDLNSNPDRIIVALGLNFNPDELADNWVKEHPNASDIKLLAGAKTEELKLGQRQYSVGSVVHLEESVTVTSSSSSNKSANPSVRRSATLAAAHTAVNRAVNRGDRNQMASPYRKEETNDTIGPVINQTTVKSTTINASQGFGDRVPSRPVYGDRSSASLAASPSSSFPSRSTHPPLNSITPSSQSQPSSVQPIHPPEKVSPKKQDEQCIGRQWDGTEEIWR
ncbi:MAG: DUF5331 domain-containing protein, partial [Merismopedia sp. SIO2A8]|nr:DUF5331 domain-containing protein [Merismopedia sp. SIO2A8]